MIVEIVVFNVVVYCRNQWGSSKLILFNIIVFYCPKHRISGRKTLTTCAPTLWRYWRAARTASSAGWWALIRLPCSAGRCSEPTSGPWWLSERLERDTRRRKLVSTRKGGNSSNLHMIAVRCRLCSYGEDISFLCVKKSKNAYADHHQKCIWSFYCIKAHKRSISFVPVLSINSVVQMLNLQWLIKNSTRKCSKGKVIECNVSIHFIVNTNRQVSSKLGIYLIEKGIMVIWLCVHSACSASKLHDHKPCLHRAVCSMQSRFFIFSAIFCVSVVTVLYSSMCALCW